MMEWLKAETLEGLRLYFQPLTAFARLVWVILSGARYITIQGHDRPPVACSPAIACGA